MLFSVLSLFINWILTVGASIDKVKNFKIDHPELVKRSDDSQNLNNNIDNKFQSAQSKIANPNTNSDTKSKFPDEMNASFEAFGKFFTLKLKRNDDLLSNDLKIVTIGDDEKEESVQNDGVAYNGVYLDIKDGEGDKVNTSTSDTKKFPFARFFATLKDDGNIRLQGGFEWDRNFFKITNENHPNVKYHVSPHEISLLKRSYEDPSDDNNNGIVAHSKKARPVVDDMVILKNSMDSRKNSGSFGFSFNSGSNSTVPFRCGHDDLNFNVDPRGVANDFLAKLTKRDLHDHEHEEAKINPLTAQYYLSKRAKSIKKSGDSGSPSDNGCPVNRKVLYLGIAVDSAYLSKFDGDRQAAVSNVLSDFNLVSGIYEETFNIELGIVTITIVGASKKTGTNANVPWDLPCNSNFDINDRLNAFSKWRDSQSKDLGLYHLVSGCSETSTVGVAWMNQVCQTNSFKGGVEPKDVVSGTSVTVLIPNQFAVIAHEIGHNFGAIHDCDARACQSCRGKDCKCCTCGSCDCKAKFIMSPNSGGSNLREFSPCTIGDVCYKLNVIGKCLQDPGRIKTIKKATCGNGILEEGEECDCGSEEECKGNPCCSFGCKLKEGAACSDGNGPCCKNCQFRKLEDNFKCFTSKTRCQYDTICDGSSGLCPPIKKAINGATCELDGGKCASGICTSRDLQCRTIGKRLGITKSCKQMPNTCQLICESTSNNNQCVAMNAYFIDGTTCGTSGTCTNGKCSETSISSFMEDNSALVIVMGATVGALLFVLLLRALFTITRN